MTNSHYQQVHSSELEPEEDTHLLVKHKVLICFYGALYLLERNQELFKAQQLSS